MLSLPKCESDWRIIQNSKLRFLIKLLSYEFQGSVAVLSAAILTAFLSCEKNVEPAKNSVTKRLGSVLAEGNVARLKKCSFICLIIMNFAKREMQNRYEHLYKCSISFVPSSVEQLHPLPIFPNSTSNVSRRTTREIKHIVTSNTNKARIDPCAVFARLVSLSVAFLSTFSCSSGLVSIEVGLSSSSVGFMKYPSVNACISNGLPVECFRELNILRWNDSRYDVKS